MSSGSLRLEWSGLTGEGQLLRPILQFSKCPDAMAFRTSHNSGSVSDASFISLVVSAFGVAFTATDLTYSSAPCSCSTRFTVLVSSHDSGSAMLFFPAMWTTLNS